MNTKKSKYGKVKKHEVEILAMVAAGKTQAEIAKHLGFKDQYVIKEFLKRQRRRERKIEAGILIPRRGRPASSESKDQLIERLKMENELLRDFLQAAGRK